MVKRRLHILLIVLLAVILPLSGYGVSVKQQRDAVSKSSGKPWVVYTAKNISFNGMFSDNMVLQRGMNAAVWGTADPGGTLCVGIDTRKKETAVDKDGKWKVTLGPMKAGGPYTLTVKGEKEIVFKNVMIGDVWICSGQSNMGWSVAWSNNGRLEIGNAKYPNIRLFDVPNVSTLEPQEKVNSVWIVCSPETVGRFSAVAYFFGRDLYKHLNVPIGLINTSWGGTPAEAWTTYGTLESLPETKPITDRWLESLKTYPERKKEYDKALAWHKEMKRDGMTSDRHRDPGNSGFAKGYANADFDDASWKTMKNPGVWEGTQKDMQIDGVVWFRKEITIPGIMAGKELILTLGAIDDFDITYFNGEKIGETTSSTADWWTHPRKYTVPAAKVQAGKQTVSVRVFDHFGGGGFSGPSRQMALKTSNGTETISLAGEWKYIVEHNLNPKALKPKRGPRLPMGPGNPWAPAGLYNGMIHPLIQYGIKGAIWYQGEANAGRAVQYRTLMKAMIKDWRRAWAQGDFPFFITQLANYRTPKNEPAEDSWAELREAQVMATELPGVGIAVIIDIGDEKDIHPRNKQDVGKRLALSARAIAYGENIVHSGPMYDSHTETADGKILIKFKHIGSGLVAKGGELKRFAIAGEDKEFVWAKAVIEGDMVVVSSPDVPEPRAVRYAWETNPEGCNLYNEEELPASPFRTDDWPARTEGKF